MFENTSMMNVAFENPICVIKSVYPTIQKSKSKWIINRIQRKCQMKQIPFVRNSIYEIIIEKSDLWKVVSMNKACEFFYGKSLRKKLNENNISYYRFCLRVKQGWDFEKALTTKI